jgi:hypothetical protein
MAEKPDMKKALDKILGDEFTEEQLQGLQLFLKVASWDRSDVLQGFVTKKPLIFGVKSCERQKLLDVSGSAGTGTDGKARFRLTDFICFDKAAFEHPINVIATPLASKPVFLTILHSLLMDPTNTFAIDVDIQVFTWDANGTAAPKIPFNWRCRVAFEDPIF